MPRSNRLLGAEFKPVRKLESSHAVQRGQHQVQVVPRHGFVGPSEGVFQSDPTGQAKARRVGQGGPAASPGAVQEHGQPSSSVVGQPDQRDQLVRGGHGRGEHPAGEVRVAFGGPAGTELTLRAGDVVMIPAGVAHCNKGQSADLLVVGAYPGGSDYDTRRGDPAEHAAARRAIAGVAVPGADPVGGVDGPLASLWA